MSGLTTGKVVCVLAATAFVGAFRVQASGDNSGEAAGATLSAARASALKTDTVRTPVTPAAAALGAVAALPALQREHAAAPVKHTAHKAKRHARKHKAHAAKHAHHAKQHKAAAPKQQVVVAPPAPAPTATVVPVAPRRTYTPPAAPQHKSYVGKSFDSKG